MRGVRVPERIALTAAVESLRRDASRISLKRLSHARAFIGLLALMGFAEDEVALTVTNQAGRHLSSAQLHAFLRGAEAKHPLSTRQGWTGSLIVRIRPSEIVGPRRGWDAVRFALAMLSIDQRPR